MGELLILRLRPPDLYLRHSGGGLRSQMRGGLLMTSARLGLRGEGLFPQQVSLKRTMSPSRIFTQMMLY